MASADGDTLKIPGVGCVGKAGSGLFKATPQQLGWKSTDPAAPSSEVALKGEELAGAVWQPCCGQGKGLLKLLLKSGLGGASRLTGFKPEAKAQIAAHFKRHFSVALQEENTATEGWSWGELQTAKGDSGASDLRLMVNGKLGFEISLNDIKQVSTARNDLNVELQEDRSCAPSDDSLAEIRFQLPQSAEDLAGELLRRAGPAAGGGAAAGEAIASVPEVTIVAPRGKHDFDFLPQAVRIRGKTQTYMIQYRSVSRIFLLELGALRPGGARWTILLGLDPPLRTGQQTHSFLVLLFDESTVRVDLPEDKLKALSLARGEEHPKYSLFGKLIKEMTDKTIAGTTKSFKDKHPQQENCVVCTYKSQRGSLFLLKKSLIFITKPVVWKPYAEVLNVSLTQGQLGRSRSFDFEVQLRDGQMLEFAQIDKSMEKLIFDFCKEVGLDVLQAQEHERRLQGQSDRSTRRHHGFAAQGALVPAEPAAAKRSAASAAPARAAAVAAQRAVQQDGGGDDDDEEADEDFEDEGEDADDSGSDAEGLDDEEDDEPKKKRGRKAK